MNLLELRMLDILKELKEKHGAVSVKARIAQETSKLEEILRLKELSMKAGLKFTIKIGGCEAIRDLLDARIIGVNSIVAPMIESAYALKKYVEAVYKVFPEEERSQLEINCNIETADTLKQLPKILSLSDASRIGVFIAERVDLCQSMGINRNQVNSEPVNKAILNAAQQVKDSRMQFGIAGEISEESLSFFKSLKEIGLSRIETKQICFDSSRALEHLTEKGLLSAFAFELLWLKNKFNFYKGNSIEEEKRITLIENRYWDKISTVFQKWE